MRFQVRFIKNVNFSWCAVVIALLGISGCSTTPVLYSFAEVDMEVATITFVDGNPGLKMVYYDGNELPKPESKTHWSPISFPAWKMLKLIVHARYEEQNNANRGLLSELVSSSIAVSRKVEGDVEFECPPLEAGNDYKLVFRKGVGVPGKNFLVLTDMRTGKVVHEEEFTR